MQGRSPRSSRVVGACFPDPHKASAVIPRCWSHESNGKHPVRARVKTVIANNVERLGTACKNAPASLAFQPMRTKIEQASPQSRAALLTFSNGRLNLNSRLKQSDDHPPPYLKPRRSSIPQQTGAGAFFKRDETRRTAANIAKLPDFTCEVLRPSLRLANQIH